MSVTGYILQMSKPGPPIEKVTMDDLGFLDFIVKGHSTKYKIHAEVNRLITPRRLSYKTIHRRVEKLLINSLIEEEARPGGYKHGARHFRVTNRGLVYLIAQAGLMYRMLDIMTMYPQNALFETFLYKYFEKQTIKNATLSLTRLIETYMAECCMLTVYFIDRLKYYRPRPKIRNANDVARNPMLEELHYHLNWLVRSILARACIMKKECIDWRDQAQLIVSQEDHSSIAGTEEDADDYEQTYFLLSNDRKFMNAIKDLHKDFSEGYSRLTHLGSGS